MVQDEAETASFDYATSVSEALDVYNQGAVQRARTLFDRSRSAGRAFAPDRHHTISPPDVLQYLAGSG
jgi:hypothetical protein